MDNVQLLTKETLVNYFTLLSNTGYLKPSRLYNILALIYINDVITKYSCFMTEADVLNLNRALKCLISRECLIPNLPVSTNYLGIACNN